MQILLELGCINNENNNIIPPPQKKSLPQKAPHPAKSLPKISPLLKASPRKKSPSKKTPTKKKNNQASLQKKFFQTNNFSITWLWGGAKKIKLPTRQQKAPLKKFLYIDFL